MKIDGVGEFGAVQLQIYNEGQLITALVGQHNLLLFASPIYLNTRFVLFKLNRLDGSFDAVAR